VAHVVKEILLAAGKIASRVTQQGGGSASGSVPPAADGASVQITELALQVQELSRMVHKAVVSGGQGASKGPSWLTIFLLTSLGASGAMQLGGFGPLSYLLDSLFVTKNVFKKGVGRIGAEVSSLGDRVAQMRSFFSERMAALDSKQGECNEAVESLGKRVDGVARDVAQVGEGLDAVDAKIDGLGERQDLANRGIGLLCKVVMRQLNQGNRTYENRSTTAELEHYLKDELFRGKAGDGVALPGLRDLLVLKASRPPKGQQQQQQHEKKKDSREPKWLE